MAKNILATATVNIRIILPAGSDASIVTNFSGFNLRAVVATCRLATELNIPFHIIATSSEDPIFFTNYANQVRITRSSRALNINKVLLWFDEICRDHNQNKLVIVPSSEFLNRFLLDHRVIIESAGHVVPLTNKALYEQISDKKSFAEICRAHNLHVPLEFISQPTELPFVAKPLKYLSSSGRQLKPWLITIQEELEQFQETENSDDFFFQEFVQGRSFYLLYYVSKDNADVCFSQENVVQQARGGSIIAARKSTIHSEQIAAQYLAMFKSLGFHGMVMVELRQNDTNKYSMIEANPRFWGPIQFVLDHEIPLVHQFLCEAGFAVECPSPNPDRQDTSQTYLWTGGMRDSETPLCYHNYSSGQFFLDYPCLIQNDVFLRDDTLELFAQEITDK